MTKYNEGCTNNTIPYDVYAPSSILHNVIYFYSDNQKTLKSEDDF